MKMTYLIGDWVEVESYVRFYYDNSNNRLMELVKCDKRTIGQIVGCRKRMLGIFRPSQFYEDGADQAYLDKAKAVHLWLIREGYYNKPIEALETHIKMYRPLHSQCIRPVLSREPKLPSLKIRSFWGSQARDQMRSIMKNWPRDSKGRWIKEG